MSDYEGFLIVFGLVVGAFLLGFILRFLFTLPSRLFEINKTLKEIKEILYFTLDK